MKKWVWNIGEDETWNQCVDFYDTREEAYEAAKEQRGIEYGESTDNIYVGEYIGYTPIIDAEDIIEYDQCNALDMCSEAGEDYLDNIPSNALDELNKELKDIYNAWLKKYNLFPNFGGIVSIRKYKYE